jgi:Tfp pilus assembly protein PilV
LGNAAVVIFSGSSSVVFRQRRPGAFTIVEVMMAATILVVGFMGMIQAITIGSEMLATARRQTLAAQILEHEIGKLRLTSWSSLPATGTATVSLDSYFDNAIAACGLTASSITLSRTTTAIDPDGDGTADMKNITFTLAWTKSGTTTAATAPTGNWLDQLAFYRPSATNRTYTRKSTAIFGKYGLNLSMQRS